MRNTALRKAVLTMVLALSVFFQVLILATPTKSQPEHRWMITRCRPTNPNNYAVRCGLPGHECTEVMNCTEFPYP
jgi:hypothetical protein